MPQLVGKTLPVAQNEAERHSVQLEVLGSGNLVREQYPQADEIVGPGQKIFVLTQEKEKITLPELTGWSKRDVVQLCSVLDWTCTMSGDGYVQSYRVQEDEQTKQLHVQFVAIDELDQDAELQESGSSESSEATEASDPSEPSESSVMEGNSETNS